MSTISAGTTSTTTLIHSGDTTGSLVFKTNDTGSGGTTAMTIDTSQGVAFAKGFTVGSTAFPTFSAYLGSNQTVTAGVATKIQLNTEDFDTASCFDNATNYRFTPNVAGYYQLNLNANAYNSVTGLTDINLYVYKNGSAYALSQSQGENGSLYRPKALAIVVYANGSTDYFEAYMTLNGTGGTYSIVGSSSRQTMFSGVMVRSA
jgi:hypothetical protein